jgi:hypothetical protein
LRPIEAVKTFDALVKRRGWNQAQTLAFIKALAARGLSGPPVEGGSANFTQISGPGGRVQTFTGQPSIQTFIWNPAALKGQLAGGDFLYTKRFKFRNMLVLENTNEGAAAPPSWERVAQCFGNVRVYSPFLGEVVPKNLNSVPIISNHDQYFSNGFRPITRQRPQASTTAASSSIAYEFIFEVAFERDYLIRGMDSCPWLPFFEGGIIEVDLAPQTAIGNGWQVVSCQQTCTADWYPDKQALIHAPIQNRLYRVTTTGPEFVLKGVGSPNGLDGVISGSRLAVMSWLANGFSVNGGGPDNGFYAAFGGSGGQQFGTNGLTRLDVPFRDQVSIDDVSAWLESFLSDCNPIRMFEALNQILAVAGGQLPGDITQWPFVMGASGTQQISQTDFSGPTQSLVSNLLDFWPMIWPAPGDKISDFQKVNGDLSFTATQPNPPGSSILNLFRTDEVCGFTPDKVMDLMDRMGMPHVQRGGTYEFVPKYAGAKKADPTTVWGFPLKIIQAK